MTGVNHRDLIDRSVKPRKEIEKLFGMGFKFIDMFMIHPSLKEKK